ncbi:unnamed protein product [Gongylonema pulchrum]|uniref:LisH domain-containing protein n=1 Tax=Gongylonema pulchrum TaxID=637853 RepID=A0A183ED87_9BILA|nr:unnamed protein product [Gongylonema pulchrum]
MAMNSEGSRGSSRDGGRRGDGAPFAVNNGRLECREVSGFSEEFWDKAEWAIDWLRMEGVNEVSEALEEVHAQVMEGVVATRSATTAVEECFQPWEAVEAA